MDIGALQDWIGRSETVEDEVGLGLMRRLAALLDRDPATLKRGDPLPTGWHAVLFWPLAPQSGPGPDGHPKRGDFMPPIPLPRRMFAGRRTWFRAPIRIGADVKRVSTIAAITPKTGRSGQMVFVTIRHGIKADGVEAVVEEQDLVYREAARPGAAAPAPPPLALPAGVETLAFTPTTTLLFRYSAVTYNGHRIHYDADYAREAEGYPALVVNGGLTTILLTELARRKLSGPLAYIASRAGRPLYAGRPATLACHAPAPGKLNLWAVDDGGRVAFEAVAESA